MSSFCANSGPPSKGLPKGVPTTALPRQDWVRPGYWPVGQGLTSPPTLASVQARALDEMLSGAPLLRVLEAVARSLEAIAGPGVHAMVMLGEDRSHLACAASPSMEPRHCLDWLDLTLPAQVPSTEAWVLDIEALPCGLPWREATLRHQLRAFWSVPIRGGSGHLLGTLDTYWPAPLPETPPELSPGASPAHAEAARLLARTAALAIEHERLCQRVAALEAGATAVCTADNDAPINLRCPSRTDELTELTRHLQRVQEEERSRLALELHDRLGGFFTATKFDMARLKSALGPVTPAVAIRLAHFTDMLDKGIALKRRMIEDLRPSALTSLGLVQALEILINEFTRTHDVPVRAALAHLHISAGIQLTIYRLVQEALVNVAAHAQAKEVSIWIKTQPDGALEVGVCDDGVGFDVQTGRISMLGLLGMHYRVESEGGCFNVQSRPNGGATVSAVFPANVSA